MSNLKKRIDVRYILTLAASILIALAIGGVLMMLTGFNPFEAYGAMIEGSIGSPRFIGNTLERAMMLCLRGCYRGRLLCMDSGNAEGEAWG